MTETPATEFGTVLRAWFARNEWPQMVAEQVARAKGSKIGPWASQMSNAMQGKLEPKPPFFVALGWFNQIVTERDFVGITDRRLIDRLLNGQPLTHDDGQPWTAVDFFALYVGDVPAPGEEAEDPKEQEPPLTQEMVDKWLEGLRLAFRECCKALMAPPGETWKLVCEYAVRDFDTSAEDLEWTQECIAGVTKATVEQATNVRRKYARSPVINSILKIIDENGGQALKTRELLEFMELVPRPKTLSFKGLPTLIEKNTLTER